MTRLSNWKEESDLFEVVTGKMTDKEALKKVDEKKGIKNKVVINPKLTEAIKELGGELIEATEEDENGATVDPRKEAEKKSEDQKKKQIENKQKRAQMIKKQVLMKKLIAVRQGSEDIVAHHEPKGSYIKEASAVLDANTKIKNKDDRKKKEAELRRLLNHAIAMKKGRAESVEPEGEAIDERTLSSYIPSDRQGEARRANLDYTKAQLKKKEDESTKNRGDLSKRDAGKMAKERLHNKKIMSLGEEGEVLDERLGGKGYKPYKSLTGKKVSGDWEDSDRGAGNKAKKRAGGKVEKKSPTYLAHVHNKEGYESKKTGEVLAAFKRDPKVRKRFEKAAKKEDGPGSVKNRAADSMLQTAKDTAKRKGDTSKSDDRYAYEEVQLEAKVDKGRSDYGKASIRNYRRKGPGHGEPAMFDPENKRGKLIDKRREEHKARRGVKGAKVPAYKVNEDKALELVRANIIKKHGKGAIYDPKNVKKPSEADKAKAAAERKKRQDSDNKAYAARAKKAGFKSTQDYTNVVARYGSEDNYRKGRGLGT